MSKRIVCCVDIGEVPFKEFTLPLLLEYAKRCNASFQVFTTPSELQPAFAFWKKIDIIKWFASQEYYTELLILDLDIVPNFNNFEDVFLHLNEGEFWMSKEMWCDGEVTPAYKEFCKLFNKEPIPPTCNSGVVLMNWEAAKKIDISPPYPDIPMYEQDYLSLKCYNNPDIDAKFFDYKYNWVLAGEHKDDVVFYHCAFHDKWLIPSMAAKFNPFK